MSESRTTGEYSQRREAQKAAHEALMEAQFEAHRQEHIAVVAEALRQWQRQPGITSTSPTTLWIDKAEEPAAVAVDALIAAGVVFARLESFAEDSEGDVAGE